MVAVLRPLQLNTRAISHAVGIAMRRPIHSFNFRRPGRNAASETARIEFHYRAAFILASSRRIHDALRKGRPITEALNAERTLYRRHLDAQAVRQRSAIQADRVARKEGRTLGWYAKIDSRTSPECRAANGKNFVVDRRPRIGYPGSVHPSCRCRSGPPHDTEQMVDTRSKRRTA